MQIVDHRLKPGWYKASPHHGGALEAPSLLVMHFTVSGAGAKGVADYFVSPTANASAHVVVGRDGEVRQVVPFNVKAWHAGRSVWRGRPNCNDYAIGIEIDNWGRLMRTADGQVRSSTSRILDPALAVEMTHKNETRPCLWEVYGETQMPRSSVTTISPRAGSRTPDPPSPWAASCPSWAGVETPRP